MKIFRILYGFAITLTLLSCDLDRDRVQARENKLEGSWVFVSMEYKDANGQLVNIGPSGSSTVPSNVLTLIQADRTGVLKVNDRFHIFSYIYGNDMITLTFEQKGDLEVEAVDVPLESIGKVYIYKYSFINSDHSTVVFRADKQYFKTKNQTITDVKYTYAKNLN